MAPPASHGEPFGTALWILGAAGAALLAGWAYRTRGAIQRFYYRLTPHPAAHLINRAIRRNEALDEHALTHALARVLPRNAAERDVRAVQAQALTIRARSHTMRLALEEQREHAYAAAQAELAEATLTHELAHARLDGVQKHTRSS